jgi:hypothetical protein
MPNSIDCGTFSTNDLVTSGETWVLNLDAQNDQGFLQNGTQLVAPEAGYYALDCYLHWQASGNGFRIMEWRVNGTEYINGTGLSPTGSTTDVRLQVGAIIYLNKGDYVEATCYQDSAQDLGFFYATAAIAKLKSA